VSRIGVYGYSLRLFGKDSNYFFSFVPISSRIIQHAPRSQKPLNPFAMVMAAPKTSRLDRGRVYLPDRLIFFNFARLWHLNQPAAPVGMRLQVGYSMLKDSAILDF